MPYYQINSRKPGKTNKPHHVSDYTSIWLKTIIHVVVYSVPAIPLARRKSKLKKNKLLVRATSD